MNTYEFILGLVGILVVGTVAVLGVLKGVPVGGSVNVARLMKLKIKVGTEQQAAIASDIRSAAAERGQTEASPLAPLPARIRQGRILWLDDQPDNNLHETIALERVGLSVVKAASGAAALRYVEAGEFDLVITDLHRPGDGMPEAEFVRQVRQRQASVRVIIYTSSAGARAAVDIAGVDLVTDDPAILIRDTMTTLSVGARQPVRSIAASPATNTRPSPAAPPRDDSRR